MERFSQRESVLLGYNNLQRPFFNMNSKTSKPFRNSDVDFHDVFGGPPRRFSMQEFRPEFKIIDAAADDDDDDDAWSSSDKPVFGDDGVSRRKLPSADFFNDIFGGDTAVNSTPKRHGRDHVFPASPGSRALSPLPPSKAEAFGSSSLLSQFSLPAKVSKALEVPTFGSSSSPRSQNKHKEGSSPNGISHSLSSATSLSRFSSQESPNPNKSANSKDSENSGASSANNSGHFHFSIYKWASKGVPLDIPRRRKSGGSSRSKDAVTKADDISDDNNSNNKTTPLVASSSSNGHTVQSFPSPTLMHSNNNSKLQNGLPHNEVGTVEEERQINGVKDEPAKTIGKKNIEEPRKSEVKPVHSLFYDDLERGLDETGKTTGQNTSMGDKTRKTQERKNASSEVERVKTVPLSPRRESNGKSRVKGRVKEFVKMFNQEVIPPKSAARDGFKFRSRSCNWKEKPNFEDEQMIDTIIEEEKFQMPKVNEDLKQSAKVHACEHDHSTQFSDSISVGSKTTVEESDESVHDNFQVKEITQVENGHMEFDTQKTQELKEIDAKIRQWTKGKEGNIRSLLSTLQYVLWAESGWKAVPLVDIIEGNAVKRAYQRALLCLHPDKLQQKGAASHQKYLAEKVFDILQEAWNYFNSLGAV